MNFKKISNFAVVALILFFSLFLFINQSGPSHKNEIEYVKIAGKTLKIELANTTEKQIRGLSGRESIGEEEGMLFVFSEKGKNYFWMKDMKFPIDIIWIDENLKIIYIKNNALPESFPDFFGPEEDSKYVLEVLGSFSEKNNLKVGDSVIFLP